jgi:hypothetical protein
MTDSLAMKDAYRTLRMRHARFYAVVMEAIANCAREKWLRYPELMN